MATQVIRQQSSAAVPQEKAGRGQRFRDFFSKVDELLGVYFAPHASISRLEKDYWAALSDRQKVEIRADLMGMRQ